MLNKLKDIISIRFLEPKLAFLHVPKTGGTYLVQRETDQKPVLPIHYLGHYYVVDRKNIPNPLYYAHSPQYYNRTISLSEIQKYYVISTCRNIFSWLVSYMWHAGGLNPKYNDPYHYDYTAANKTFEYLVKTIANREDLWPNRKFIHAQFFCNNGQLVVDWINRNESLDHDIEILARKNNLRFTPHKKQRVAHQTDYRTYYTDALIELVYKTWGRELNLFGYEFDGQSSESNKLYQAISKKTKKLIRYVLDKDELTIDGKTINR